MLIVMMLEHIKEFSRHCDGYDAHMHLQKEVATYLVSKITSCPKTILDLGCGNGAVFKNITWDIEHFDGVDSAKQMADKHPVAKEVRIIQENFESPYLSQHLLPQYDLIISSSALQWAQSIEKVVAFCALACKEGAFAIFTDKTFEAVYHVSGLQTFLPNAKILGELFNQYFTCKQEIRTFKLYFEDNISKFRYIKQSGVSGGKKQLSVAQTKALIQNYPYDYLECEVLFIWGIPKRKYL
ncbi:MAG: methyltransferase domain-containing protein [Sulfurospirillaceae bacterium]|nr:methyltransferase domain-containing protein [Sulfurospirillaceae bacterium]